MTEAAVGAGSEAGAAPGAGCCAFDGPGIARTLSAAPASKAFPPVREGRAIGPSLHWLLSDVRVEPPSAGDSGPFRRLWLAGPGVFHRRRPCPHPTRPLV